MKILWSALLHRATIKNWKVFTTSGKELYRERLSWKAKVSNKEVCRRTGQMNMESTLWRRRLRWLGHELRMEERKNSEANAEIMNSGFSQRTGMTKTELTRNDDQRAEQDGSQLGRRCSGCRDCRGSSTTRQRVTQCIMDAGWTKRAKGLFLYFCFLVCLFDLFEPNLMMCGRRMPLYVILYAHYYFR